MKEERIFRYKSLFMVFIIFIINFSIVGLLFDLVYGPWWGLGAALFLVALFCKWGEKFVLVFAKARYVTDDEVLINQVKNFCCHLNIKEVKIYWSNSFVNNVYYSDSYFGKPALIIGKNIYTQFNRNELNSLIYASLMRVRSGEAKNRTLITLLFVVIYSPVFIVRSLFSSIRIRRSFEIFFYPAFSLKSMMYENEKEVLSFDAEVGKMKGLRKDYVAAIFKISQLPSFYENSVGALVMTELSHAKNSSQDVINNILFKRVEIKKRMNALGRNC